MTTLSYKFGRICAKSSRLMMAALVLGCLGTPVAAQTGAHAYPERSIRMLVPFAPGGASDIVARVVGQKLAEALSQPVVIDNRPGAGGNIAAEAALHANSDGYTILVVADAGRVKGLYQTLSYNIVEDFTPITLGTVTPMMVVVSPELPVKSVSDLLTLAKQQRVLFGSGGIGSSTEIAGLLFNALGHVHLEEVTYKSIPPAVPDLLAGRLGVAFLPVQLAVPLVSGGQLKALAVTSRARLSAWPDLPTVAEAGLPGYEHYTWAGFVVRAGTPKSIVNKLNTEIVRILNLPDVREKLTSQGAEIAAGTPEDFARTIDADIRKQKMLVEQLGVGQHQGSKN
jgi:tripartite-type tricarboxylate transporter receptor subunit TctC